MGTSRLSLPVIVFAQFCCTSLWFAGNGVMNDLIQTIDLGPAALGHLTSAVQFDFITGTLGFAFLGIADRFSPSKVFFYSAIFGALFNLGILVESNSSGSLLMLRFLTGFSLAGIYPVGMKIASDYYREGRGKSLGFLVGALVLGTALPHLLMAVTGLKGLPWKSVLVAISFLALLGGSLIFLLVQDGPYRSPMLQKDFSAMLRVFNIPKFRAAAFGYFGHMWELYAFWAFVPVLLKVYSLLHLHSNFNIPLLSFFIIGSGGLACAVIGFLSQSWGTKKSAAGALLLSAACCIISPFMFWQTSETFFIIFLLFWGMVVVADSPLFSTLVAKHAPSEARGTALTVVNCIGFAITIVSIELISFLLEVLDPVYLLLFLAPGPLLGLLVLFRKRRNQLQRLSAEKV